MEHLLDDIVKRITKLCRRRGYPDNDDTVVNNPELAPLFAPDGPQSQPSAVAQKSNWPNPAPKREWQCPNEILRNLVKW